MFYCQLCFENNASENTCIDLLEDNGDSEYYKSLIMKYLHIKMFENGYLEKLCPFCCEKLKAFDKFYNQVQQQQNKRIELYEAYKNVSFRRKEEEANLRTLVKNDATLCNLETEINYLTAEDSQKEELINFEDNVITDSETVVETWIGSDDIKKAVHPQKNALSKAKGKRKRKSSSKTKICRDAKADALVKTDTPLDEALKSKGETIVFEDDVESETIVESRNALKDEKLFIHQQKKTSSKAKCKEQVKTSLKAKICRASRVRKLSETDASLDRAPTTESVPKNKEIRDETILSYMQLKCDVCQRAGFEKFTELREHFREEHKMQAYVICCDNRFSRRYTLLDHVRWHLDPNIFRCKICDKQLKSRNCFDLHMKVRHSAQEKRSLECSYCGKRFVYSFLLNKHLESHMGPTESCHICKKSFKPSSLKTHIQYVHGEVTRLICDTCGKEYKSKQCFVRHVAEHQGIVQEATEECQECGKWFKPQHLSKHMETHAPKHIECYQCHKLYPTTPALRSHISSVHGEAKFQCTYCGKAFTRQKSLRDHIGLHTGQKDHLCPHCEREFRSKANMYAHIKRDHFEQWKLSRNNRSSLPKK